MQIKMIIENHQCQNIYLQDKQNWIRRKKFKEIKRFLCFELLNWREFFSMSHKLITLSILIEKLIF